MARKRLNKKVELVGSMVLVVFAMAAIFVFLRFSGDPQKFIEDGDAAIKAAKEATDDEIKKELYAEAKGSYHKARKRAKNDLLSVKILFRLADLHLETGEWKFVQGCWYKIIQLDPKSVKARFGRLKYFFIMADHYANSDVDALGVWKEVRSQASDFIDIADDSLLAQDTAKWESFEINSGVDAKSIGSFLYLLRGRATFEVARMGAESDTEESFDRAMEDLKKAIELEPDNVNAYWYLMRATFAKSDIFVSRGETHAKKNAAEQAEEILKKAVEAADDDPLAHINLLKMKPVFARFRDAKKLKEQIEPFEPEYLSLVDRFDSSAQAYAALAQFYRFLGHQKFDEAIEAMERARQLDKENIDYIMSLAELYSQRFFILSAVQQSSPEDIRKAIELAKGALTLPGTRETEGPRKWANRKNRIWFYDFLASCCIGLVLEPYEEQTPSETQEWLKDAEEAVYAIEQIYGSGEAPHVIRCQGMLALAKGNKNEATRKLYTVYEQLQAAGTRGNPRLSYALAKIFKDTSEIGAVIEFLQTAILSRIALTKPEAHLDYAETLLKLNNDASRKTAVTHINIFEKKLGPNERSQTLRIEAYTRIGAMKFLETEKGIAKFRLNEDEQELARTGFEKAEEELARIAKPNDPNIIRLKVALIRTKIGTILSNLRLRQVEETPDVLAGSQEAAVSDQATEQSMTVEVRNYRNTFADLVEKLLATNPNSFKEAYIVPVCNHYIAEGRIEKAKNLVNEYLEHFPDNVTALFYKQVLSEPDPANIAEQRHKEIQKQAISNITDPLTRAMSLGIFHRSYEPNEAIEEFKKVLAWRLEATDEADSTKPEDKKIIDTQHLAATYLFNIAIRTKNLELAEQMAEICQRENIDGCEGQFFAARLAVAKEEYKDALTRLDECLRLRPVFSDCFKLRSRVNTLLGNEHIAIEDIKKAESLNPLNKNTMERLAIKLYERNRKLADNVTADQVIEAQNALIDAIRLNPRKHELQALYAEYMSEENPQKALAILQRLQKAFPSVQNALALGKMAIRIATRQINADQKKFFFDTAASAFDQALAIDPQDKIVLSSYAEYYRLTGQEEKAKKLLEQSQDKKLLYVHYFRNGQLDNARDILEQLYQVDSKDTIVVEDLLVIAERTGDKEAVKRYSDELLSLDDSMGKHLIQIQSFLKVGLVKDAEYKLQSFNEKYPAEPQALLLESQLVMGKGQLEKALELANRSLETDQDSAVAWLVRGKTNFLMTNYDQAITDLRKAKQLAIGNMQSAIVARTLLAKTYLRARRYEDAVTELKDTIDLQQTSMESRKMLEQTYLQLGRKESLKKFYEQTLDKFPDSVFWYNRAGAFAIAQADYGKAEQLYSQALQKSNKAGNDDSTALAGYLQTLLLAEKLDKVFEEGRKHIDGQIAPIAYLRMAEAKLKLDERATAIQYCRKAVDKAGTDEKFTSVVLEKMYFMLGAEEVQNYCQERLQDNPDSFAANFTMFNLKRVNREYNKAIAYLDKCIQISGPNSLDKTELVIKKVRLLDIAYKKTSDKNYLDRAIAEYESLRLEMPNNSSILNNLAYILAENNEKLTEALRYAKQALEISPDNPGILDTYAYVLYKNEKYPEAAEYLQAALQQHEHYRIPPSAGIYEHLGMIKEKLGARAEALAAYEQALKTAAGRLPENQMQQIKTAIERVSN